MAHVPRLHWPQPLQEGEQLRIDDARAHHLLRVLKRRVGDALILFRSPDIECEALIEAADKRSLSVRITACRQVHRESPLQVRLVQGISRGDRMDFSIQKCVELGATAIQPVWTSRSGVQLSGPRLQRKQQHWQAVAESAAEQSGRTIVPMVLDCEELRHYLSSPRQGYVLALGEDAQAQGQPESALDLLVGPEGGLDNDEIIAANNAGLKSLTLGPRTLRTETAGLAALSWLQCRWGDFPS